MIVVTRRDSRCKIEGVDDSLLGRIRKVLSYETDFWSRKMAEANGQKMPERISVMTPTGTFPEGVFTIVIQYLKHEKLEYQIKDERTPIVIPDKKKITEVVKMMPFKPRPYQLETIVAGAITHRNALVSLPTGSGKTFILTSLLYVWDRPSLILVNRKELMYQIQSEIAMYRGLHLSEVGLIGDSKYNPKFVTVALVQSLTRSKGKQGAKVKEFLKTIEALYVDECHHALSPSYKAVMRACTNAVVRYGFSATPYSERKENLGVEIHKDIVLRALFGPFIGKIKTRDLIDQGWLADVEVRLIENKVYNDGVRLSWADEYDRVLIRDNDRNDIIAKIIHTHYTRGQNVVGFVKRLDHGYEVARILTEKYKIPKEALAFINGEDFVDYRKEMISSFQGGELKILLGTVLSEGLNFLADVGINISAGRSQNEVVQRVGRVLRKPRDPKLKDVNPNEHRSVLFYDFVDDDHPWFKKHSKIRQKVYNDEGHKIVTLKVEDI